MAHAIYTAHVPAPPAAVWAWHAAESAFLRLGPPWIPMRLIRREGGLLAGAVTEFEVTRAGVTLRWLAKHVEGTEGRSFVDEQAQGPFSAWRHEHRFLAEGDGTRLEDEVTWQMPTGTAWASAWMQPDIDAMFRWRHHRTIADLARFAPYAGLPPLTVGITGASGLVGQELTSFLVAGGHRVVAIRRDGSTPIAGLDAVVNLAGESIADGRWNDAKKHAITESRVALTRRLCEQIAASPERPTVLVSGSAVGFYGDRGDALCPEDAGRGEGFLADTCAAWEAATAPAAAAGVRVVHLRTGIVLSPKGGWLSALLPLVRAGVAGPAGDGNQWMPWIDLDDLVGMIHHALRDPAVSGPMNGVAPEPLTNRALMRCLGHVLRRPTVLPTPGFVLSLALGGEKAQELVLSGQRAVPGTALSTGFRFVSPEAGPALRMMLGVSPEETPDVSG